MASTEHTVLYNHLLNEDGTLITPQSEAPLQKKETASARSSSGNNQGADARSWIWLCCQSSYRSPWIHKQSLEVYSLIIVQVYSDPSSGLNCLCVTCREMDICKHVKKKKLLTCSVTFVQNILNNMSITWPTLLLYIGLCPVKRNWGGSQKCPHPLYLHTAAQRSRGHMCCQMSTAKGRISDASALDNTSQKTKSHRTG